MLADEEVAQVLAEYLDVKYLAAIARCSKSCHTAYKPLAQHLHSRQLWQTARLTLRMPPLRWMQHVFVLERVPPGTPLWQLSHLGCLYLGLLLSTLNHPRKLLQQQVEHCLSGRRLRLRDCIQGLLDHPGPLLAKDQYLLKQLLQKCDDCPAVPQHHCRHQWRTSARDQNLLQLMPRFLLHLMLVWAMCLVKTRKQNVIY